MQGNLFKVTDSSTLIICGFVQAIHSKWKSKGHVVIVKELSHMYSDYFSLSAYDLEWWHSSLLQIHCFMSLLSPIWSIQGPEKLDTLGVRLAALTPTLAPVCEPPPPSWASWILKASLRFWARISLLCISSTTRLGNHPLSPSWSRSPIIQPGIHKTKKVQSRQKDRQMQKIAYSKLKNSHSKNKTNYTSFCLLGDIRAGLCHYAPSSVLSRRFKTSAISMESSSGSWDEYDWIHCTCGVSKDHTHFEFMSLWLDVDDCLHCWVDTFVLPGWWVLVDINRVRRFGVRAHIHRSLSLLSTGCR